MASRTASSDLLWSDLGDDLEHAGVVPAVGDAADTLLAFLVSTSAL